MERRSLFQRRPPEFVRAVLTATQAAYADGVTEAIDVKQRAEHDPEAEVAPRI